MTRPKVPPSSAGFVATWLLGDSQGDERPGIPLLHAYLEARRRGEVPSEATLGALERAFERIVAGELADDALQLRRAKKRPRNPKTARRDVEIVVRLVELRSAGINVPDAKAQIVAEYGISEDVADRLHKEYLAGNPSIPSKGQALQSAPWFRYVPKPTKAKKAKTQPRGGAK